MPTAVDSSRRAGAVPVTGARHTAVADTPRPGALRLGESLVAQGLVSPDQLHIALTEQKRQHVPIGRLLVQMGFVSEAILRDQTATKRGQHAIDLSQVAADAEALSLVPQSFARRHHVLPLAYDAASGTLTVAASERFNLLALDQLRGMLGAQMQLKTLLAVETQIDDRIDQFYGHELSVDGILREIETGEADSATALGHDGDYEQPLVRLVDALLVDAVKRGASDLHFEPEATFLRVRYRIDGVLEQIRSLHKGHWPGMAVRLKVMSGLNIAEMRAPQDGRISLTLNGRAVDFRVSTQPTLHGENVVLRVLDRDKAIIRLDQMRLPPAVTGTLGLMLARPEGIVIITGPTGSGKTTTLYSLLGQLNDEAVNIMTLEDPVEYPVPRLRQTSVNEAAKVDFATGIRAMMRQDPDIILVGEVRDRETAEMAFRAAMTGHQVFTTLHTNSALGVFPRLFDIGIPADIIAGNIIGVIAQRLLRVLCRHCREPYSPSEEERLILGLHDRQASIHRPVGCAQCAMKGYRGRAAVMEILRMDADLDELVARRATARDLRQVAVSKGFRSLAQEGVARILDGTTSIAEVARCVDLTEFLGPG